VEELGLIHPIILLIHYHLLELFSKIIQDVELSNCKFEEKTDLFELK